MLHDIIINNVHFSPDVDHSLFIMVTDENREDRMINLQPCEVLALGSFIQYRTTEYITLNGITFAPDCDDSLFIMVTDENREDRCIDLRPDEVNVVAGYLHSPAGRALVRNAMMTKPAARLAA